MERKFFVLGCLALLAGCASAPKADEEAKLQECQAQAAAYVQKLDLAKNENASLRRERVLFKAYKDLDTSGFSAALSVYQKELAPDMAAGDTWVALTDRGIVVTVSVEKLFTTGTDALETSGKEFLDRVAALIKKTFPRDYIYVEGHTDNQSLAIFEYKSDWDFSFARALSVLKYLEDKGELNPWQLSAAGFGRYRPRASNETRDGRRLNRRIEIVISPQQWKQSTP